MRDEKKTALPAAAGGAEAGDIGRGSGMFGDPMTYPAEINEITADDIIIDALCLYFGDDALDKQEPGDPRVIRALENMELLSYILWRRHIKGKGWEGLAKALDRRVAAIWDGAIDARREEANRGAAL